ncbi:MAG: rod shape-determining protein MreC [Ignavibacteria bacterium]|jgi:rod shape-determining protein MreC|nr:rod shape-determining protein MreC [Ignavibacteria bacterium]MDH7527214.1 rod shape-determining protein MreC [Ignavibacteria bacterium]
MIYWLVRFINNYRQYVIFSILLLASLFLLSLNDSKEISNLRKASFIIYGLIDYIKSPFEDFIYSKTELEILKKENAELTQQLLKFREFEKERNELIELLKFEKENPVKLINARIILKSSDPAGNKFIINKGKNDGVRLNATVFSSSGLIGYVSDLMSNYSVVYTINNLNVRISVKNARSGALGILSWDGEKFKIFNVNKSADVREGDLFITSEFSSLFPSGLPVARVTYASQSKETLFYDITAKPSCDLNEIRFCFISETSLNNQKLNFLLSQSE